MKLQRVEVTWVDITSKSGWYGKEDYKDELGPGLEFTTVGYYVKHDTEYLYMAETHGEDRWGGMVLIPRGVIKSVRVLGLGKEMRL